MNFLDIQPNIYRYSLYLCRNKEEAKELTQQSNLKILQGNYHPQKGKNYSNWAMRIVHNEFVNIIRAKKDFVKIVDFPYNQNIISEKTWLNRRLRAISHNGIREVMICRFKFGMKYEEIASSMKCPLGSVKEWINQGREKIINQYE